MKTYAHILTVLVAAMVSVSTFASGVDSSAYQGALFNGDSTRFFDKVHSGGPRLISVGIGVQQQKRTMERGNSFENDMQANHIAAVLGLDLTKWLTVYGGGGEADVELGGYNRSSNFEWLAGGDLRILDFLVLEPWNDIDQYWVGLNLNTFMRNTKVDSGNDSSDSLSEVFSALTMSFYSKAEQPHRWDRVGFYLGPAFSMLDFGDQSESQMFGLIGGLQVNPTPNVGIKLEAQNFDTLGLGASVTFHF